MATRIIQRAPDDDPHKQVQKGKTIKFNAQRFVTKQVGKLLEEYAIGEMLGSGGFGEVYLGRHKKSGAERAIKVVTKSPHKDDSANKAVLHEFNVVRQLDRTYYFVLVVDCWLWSLAYMFLFLSHLYCFFALLMADPNILKMYNLYQDDSYFYIGRYSNNSSSSSNSKGMTLKKDICLTDLLALSPPFLP